MFSFPLFIISALTDGDEREWSGWPGGNSNTHPELWPWQILLSNLNWPPNLCVRTWESSRHPVAKSTKNACKDFDINCQAQIPFHKNPWVQQSPQKEGIGLGNITTGKNIEMIFNFSWWFLQSGLCLGLSIVECMAWDSRVERLWIYTKLNLDFQGNADVSSLRKV